MKYIIAVISCDRDCRTHPFIIKSNDDIDYILLTFRKKTIKVNKKLLIETVEFVFKKSNNFIIIAMNTFLNDSGKRLIVRHFAFNPVVTLFSSGFKLDVGLEDLLNAMKLVIRNTPKRGK